MVVDVLYLQFSGLPQGDVAVDVLREVTLALYSVPEKARRAGSFIGPPIGAVEITGTALRVWPVPISRTLEESQRGRYDQR